MDVGISQIKIGEHITQQGSEIFPPIDTYNLLLENYFAILLEDSSQINLEKSPSM